MGANLSKNLFLLLYPDQWESNSVKSYSFSSLSCPIRASLSKNLFLLLSILTKGSRSKYCLFYLVSILTYLVSILTNGSTGLDTNLFVLVSILANGSPGLDTNLFVLVSILANGSPSGYQPVRPRLYPGQWEPVWIPTCSSSSLS
jgi:hypothetical protein